MLLSSYLIIYGSFSCTRLASAGPLYGALTRIKTKKSIPVEYACTHNRE
jgi:hypothetical protein